MERHRDYRTTMVILAIIYTTAAIIVGTAALLGPLGPSEWALSALMALSAIGSAILAFRERQFESRPYRGLSPSALRLRLGVITGVLLIAEMVVGVLLSIWFGFDSLAMNVFVYFVTPPVIVVVYVSFWWKHVHSPSDEGQR